MKIMLVDDSKTMRNIQKSVLSTLGYREIAEACDGQDALSKVVAFAPDLMLVDWNMPNMDGLQLAAVSEQGRMLIFALSDLPELPRGKGNKIIQIASRDIEARLDFVRFLTLIPRGAALTVYSGKRYFKMTPGNLAEFVGERGRRGKKLPRGFQRVDKIEINEMDAPV